MLYMQANHISYERDGRKIIDIPQLTFFEGDRIGLIGPNGCGKSTLLKLMAGQLPCELGEVKKYGTYEYIPQLEVLDCDGLSPKTMRYTHIPHQEVGCMSGGEQTRVKIGKILESYVHFFLIDEPTSSLDQEGISYFKAQLKRLATSYIIVSHDREVLDALCNKIWEMRDGHIAVYSGNYSAYLLAKEEERVHQQAAYEHYIKTKHQLEHAKQEQMKKAAKVTKKKGKKHQQDYGAKCLTSATKSYETKEKRLYQAGKAIQSRIDQLEIQEKVKRDKKVDFYIPERSQVHVPYVITGKNLCKTIWDGRCLLEDANINILTGKKVALVGVNGIGKTTLLEMIRSHEQGITYAPKVKIGYFNQKLNQLSEEDSILENVKTTSIYGERKIRTFLGQMLFKGNEIYKPVKVLSGGEKVKVTLTKLFLSEFNVLILDEPTNYLDLSTIEVLEQAMIDYPGTILFTSHDEQMIERVADTLLEIKDKKILNVIDKQ